MGFFVVVVACGFVYLCAFACYTSVLYFCFSGSHILMQNLHFSSCVAVLTVLWKRAGCNSRLHAHINTEFINDSHYPSGDLITWGYYTPTHIGY